MVIDTSAVVSIILGESAATRLVDALEMAPVRKISAASVAETCLVLLGRFGDSGDAHLDGMLRTLMAEVVPVDAVQVDAARDAAVRYGRGRHRAALNYGDCFSYALAVCVNEPLLFVGDDFSHTDVLIAEW